MGGVFLRVAQSPRIKKSFFFTKIHEPRKKKKKKICAPLGLRAHSLYVASQGGGVPEAVAAADALALGAEVG